MNSPLKLGIIGGGLNSAIGRTHHIAAQLDQRWRIACGCFSQKKDVNEATADTLHLPRDGRFTSWLDLLQDSSIDAVAVLTPTPTHAEIIGAALTRGIPVISEKSLSVNSREAAMIRRIEKETNGFLAVTFNYSGYPIVRELREWIRQGRLGQLLHIDARMPQESYIRCVNASGARPVPQAWRMRDYGIPTVSLDLGVHLHHLVDFLTGEKPCGVFGIQRSGGFFPSVIDSVECLARYSGGLQCRLFFGKCFLGEANGLRIRISGTEGAAEWYQMRPEELVFADKYGAIRQITRAACDLAVCTADRYTRFKAGHPAGYIEAFANCYADLADALMAHRLGQEVPHEQSFVSGSKVAEEGLLLLEAVSRSSELGVWVVPDSAGIDSRVKVDSREVASSSSSCEGVRCSTT
jgi:predicted dehydrogenase